MPQFSHKGRQDFRFRNPTSRKAHTGRTDVPTAILTLMQPDQAVINRWNDAAPFWEKHREVIRQMFAPVTQALVEEALIGDRHTVLDIATGPGEPALTVAALVGPEGKVIGIDPVPEMVAAARR